MNNNKVYEKYFLILTVCTKCKNAKQFKNFQSLILKLDKLFILRIKIAT